MLDGNGRVFACPQDACAQEYPKLPFGLQSLVDRLIVQSRDIFTAGEADFTIDFPLAVRIFSLEPKSSPTIALYVQSARRRSDNP